ncbi:MAG: hypothetical protein J07HQX50_02880 [Haloquadratum sp. J07HQX50]|nr:MAG: hypothetical protein J07HQX50_02880 [Haloquadratum sp. J07HQX50]
MTVNITARKVLTVTRVSTTLYSSQTCVASMMQQDKNSHNSAAMSWDEITCLIDRVNERLSLVLINLAGTTNEVRGHSCPSCGFNINRDHIVLWTRQHGLGKTGIAVRTVRVWSWDSPNTCLWRQVSLWAGVIGTPRLQTPHRQRSRQSSASAQKPHPHRRYASG